MCDPCHADLLSPGGPAQVQFEVFLPHDWSGRFAVVGNGGDAGGVNFPDMWGPIKNCAYRGGLVPGEQD